MKSNKYLTIVIGIMIVGVFLFFLNVKNKNISSPVLHLPGKDISLTVANTPETMQKGLGGRESLSNDEAMLFVFENADKHRFWMKDMKFPIDIIWIDEKYEIVHIESNVSPDSYPQVFMPSIEGNYVLEVKANFAKENNLKVGQKLNFDLPK